MASNRQSLIFLLAGFCALLLTSQCAEVSSQIEDESLADRATFEIKSMKNCNDAFPDKIRIGDIDFPKLVKLPGDIQLNGTFIVSDQLPAKWTVDIRVKIKISITDSWFPVPCVRSCKKENFCDAKFLQKCRDGFKGLTATSASDVARVCKCDLEKGSYNIPDFQMPVKLSKKREKLSGQMKGRDMMIQATFKSARDGSRFGCFVAIVQRPKKSTSS